MLSKGCRNKVLPFFLKLSSESNLNAYIHYITSSWIHLESNEKAAKNCGFAKYGICYLGAFVFRINHKTFPSRLLVAGVNCEQRSEPLRTINFLAVRNCWLILNL